MSRLLESRQLTKSFRWKAVAGRARRLVAVDRVDLGVGRGECLALVGESGSGKTTLGRCLIRLHEPDSGEVFFDGEDLLALAPAALRARRHQFQMVFQDSGSAFNPRMRAKDILAEPLRIHRRARPEDERERSAALLAQVGLGESVLKRYAHQLSGGQRQRLGIARALAAGPRLLILDEPVAALDVSVQAQILRLLESLRDDLGLAMIFISHDLAVVQQIADRVAVLYLGRLVESGPREAVFGRPQHPYTASLLASVPVPDPARRGVRPALRGEIPSPLDPPPGCPFHPRCPIARDRCRATEPPMTAVVVGGSVACHYPGEVDVHSSLR